jgi:cytochrome c5
VRYGFLFAISLTALGLVYTSGAQAQQADRGEQILNQSCGDCHDLRPIQTAAKTQEEWTATIDSMIAMGAELKADDKPVLIEHLVANHGPIPDGRGKEIVLNTCTMCHDLKRIKLGRRSPEEWEETLISMLNEGAPLSDADFPVVHAYLSKNFSN